MRSIDSDLHMDYSPSARPRTWRAAWSRWLGRLVLATDETLKLAEGYVQVKSLGPVPVRGLRPPSRYTRSSAPGWCGLDYKLLRLADSRALLAGTRRWNSCEGH